MYKIDRSLVSALSLNDYAYALVRVANPWQYGFVARRFDVVCGFPFINSLGIRCDKRDGERLKAMPEVEFVTAQGRVSALDDGERRATTADGADVSRSDGAGATAEIGRDEGDGKEVFAMSDEEGRAVAEAFSREGYDGAGVTLCVLDTGVAPHSDLSIPRDRIVAFEDRIAGRGFPYDDNGHGTFVAGVAAGRGVLSGGRLQGVAPAAAIVGVKVIEASGETGTFKILEGMQWLFDNCARLGVRVVCMSFGADPVDSADPLKAGAEMLVRRGVTVVCAAGNSGIGGLKSPGISPEVITVGAVDENLKVADFSSTGVYHGVRRPDLYAQGVRVKGLDAGGTYSFMSGTSVSAPYVAGACCLLHQRFGRLSPRDCKRLIMASCERVRGVNVFTLEREK